MSSDLHLQAKELFVELCELPESQRVQRLQQLSLSSPDLAKEVDSLLSYHSAQSMVIAQPPPKIRTRSTLSQTYRAQPSFWKYLLLRALLYSVPLALIGLVISYKTNDRIRFLLRGNVENQLMELIDQRVKEFSQWEYSEIAMATNWTHDPEVIRLVEDLTKLSEPLGQGEDKVALDNLRKAAQYKEIQSRLNQLAGVQVSFAIWDRRMTTIADSNQQVHAERIGAHATPTGASMITQVMSGKPRLYLPNESTNITAGIDLESAPANIMVLAPIQDADGNIIAFMMLSDFGLDDRYFQLFNRWTNLLNNETYTNETYLVSERGVLLTSSRYRELVKTANLARTNIGQQSTIFVRDPGVNFVAGEETVILPLVWPLTFSARQVITGSRGFSIDGYSNYVGMKVVGAWRWLAEHNVGMIVEMHEEDAFAISDTAKRSLIALTSLFAATLIALGLTTARRHSSDHSQHISDVGPYQVQGLLGEGGMGRVYLAEHALLCRQSAVKILSGDEVDMNVISRFEREVQLASQLTHPNTIAIYDFGRDKEGNFYYAMEYIQGAHLGQLVEYGGPIHPGRCIFLLRQLCRALCEAHHAGVVHRDIKPQNVMVCNRGGEPDFIKLFDYGLVKAFAPGVHDDQNSLTRVVVGTPRFMAPERLNSPWLADPRVDIYSVGAVAYYLLTGKLPPLFTSTGSSNEQPGIETLDLPVGAVEFGDLLGMCLSPEPADRPSSTEDLLRNLEELAEQFPWSREDSMVWWQNHEAKLLRVVKSHRDTLCRNAITR